MARSLGWGYLWRMLRLASSLGAFGLLCCGALGAPVVLYPGLYDVTTETLLPHLEENLRYATTHARQCLDAQDVSTLFPLLRHQAFAGCELVQGVADGQAISFPLACRNPEAASGVARLTLEPDRLLGVLEIKMGGKNMTLSQRITGPRLGPCTAGADPPR
jgi:hypothetical protein